MEIKRGDPRKPAEEVNGGSGRTILADPIVGQPGDPIYVRNVFCPPNARTPWHKHQGQVLYVLAGQGKAGMRGQRPQQILPGDVVFFPADEEHWHGATEETYVVHLTIVVGLSTGYEEVSDEEYTS